MHGCAIEEGYSPVRRSTLHCQACFCAIHGQGGALVGVVRKHGGCQNRGLATLGTPWSTGMVHGMGTTFMCPPRHRQPGRCPPLLLLSLSLLLPEGHPSSLHRGRVSLRLRGGASLPRATPEQVLGGERRTSALGIPSPCSSTQRCSRRRNRPGPGSRTPLLCPSARPSPRTPRSSSGVCHRR